VVDEVSEIQRLQRANLPAAERQTQAWLTRLLGTPVASVTLRPQPTSLNSFNGFAEVAGRQLFFKSHAEPDSAVQEYYNATILSEAGYHVVLPVHVERGSGKQIAFYPVITAPVMFDLARATEVAGEPSVPADDLVRYEQQECEKLLRIYDSTAQLCDAGKHAEAPVHQLFWHRLTGTRMKRFYENAHLALPNGADDSVPIAQVFNASWTINGVRQPATIADLVEEAQSVLAPAQPALTVVGHGDAHFGNVFLEGDGAYLYFDPAFAGRHSPLLDLAKPLFHNVFAQWMYYPEEYAESSSVDVRRQASEISVDYARAFSPLRQQIFAAKLKYLVEPTLSWLRAAGAGQLSRRVLDLALMCCPLLTMNLADRTRFSSELSWLGLALTVQMGNGGTDQNFAF
jgi:hypothetical protein